MRIIRYQNTPLYTPALSYPNLRAEMDRLFDVAFPALRPLPRNGLFGGLADEFPLDLYQDRNAFTVRAELPGFRKEDLGVEVADGVLTVIAQPKAATKSDQKEQEAAVTTPERHFRRALALPENLNVEKIEAAYENGVLTVTLPKREEVKPKQIAVQVK